MKHVITFEIDQFINELKKKLPGVVVIGYEEKPRLELWNASVLKPIVPIYKKYDHSRALKLAWLSEGKTGLLRYVEPHIAKHRLNRVRKIILALK